MQPATRLNRLASTPKNDFCIASSKRAPTKTSSLAIPAATDRALIDVPILARHQLRLPPLVRAEFLGLFVGDGIRTSGTATNRGGGGGDGVSAITVWDNAAGRGAACERRCRSSQKGHTQSLHDFPLILPCDLVAEESDCINSNNCWKTTIAQAGELSN